MELASRGAKVLFTARSPDKGAEALEDIRQRSGNDTVEMMLLDLASFRSVHSFVDALTHKVDRLDVLINNAGGVISKRLVTDEAFEMTFGSNYVAHFLLTKLVWDLLLEADSARIVNNSSVAHRIAFGGLVWSDLQSEVDYEPTMAYNRAKLAMIMFTIELARRLDGTGATANCYHPGPVRTGFGRSKDVSGWQRFMIALGTPFMVGPKRGSHPMVYLAASPKVADISGGYFSRWPLAAMPGARPRPHRPSHIGEGEPAHLWDVTEAMLATVGE